MAEYQELDFSFDGGVKEISDIENFFEEDITPVEEPKKEAGELDDFEFKEDSLVEELANQLEADASTEEPEKEEKPNSPKPEDEPEEEEGDIPGSENEHSENQIAVFANDLFNLGVLTKDDGEEDISIENEEQLLERFLHEKKKGANEILTNFLSKFGDKHVQAFQAIFVNGLDPEKYYNLSKKIDSVKDVDIENEDVQHSLIRQYYSQQLKYPEARIDRLIKTLNESGEIAEEAIVAQRELLKIEEEELNRNLFQKQQEEEHKIQERNYYSYNIENIVNSKLKTKEFDGIPITDKVASEVKQYMIQTPWKLKNGDLISEFEKDLLELKRPENFEKAVKIALLLRSNFDFTKIKEKAVSEKKDKLFNSFVTKEKTKRRTNPLETEDNFKFE